MSHVKIISIEGNIGAGKSTLLTKLEEYIKTLTTEEKYANIENRVIFLKEPIHIWEGIQDPTTGKNMIELFYENPAKYSFEFQIMVLATQEKFIADTLEQYPQCEIIISERSIEAGRNVFTKMLADTEFITSVEYQIYNILFDNCKYKLHTSIYLDICPEVCFERVGKRAREGENAIEIDYLTTCDNYYRKWLIEKKEFYQYPDKTYIINDNNISTILPVIMPLIEQWMNAKK
jgi:deoxyadenosine/deoxycytidine kinase